MRLSRNFTLKEFTKSYTAIKLGIKNEPNEEQIENMKALCNNVLQPTRDYYGKPVNVSSGFRSFALNTRRSGSSTSDHCNGKAGDLDNEEDNPTLFFYIKEHLDFDQLIWEFGDEHCPDWIHVSFRAVGNRMQVLRTVRENDKVVYQPYI